MKALQTIKSNIPVLLLMTVVPYFFYNEPSISQSIIGAVLGAVAAFKYYLEYKQQPDYTRELEKTIKAEMELMRVAYLKDFDKLGNEIEVLRKKNNGASIQKNIDNKINMHGWG